MFGNVVAAQVEEYHFVVGRCFPSFDNVFCPKYFVDGWLTGNYSVAGNHRQFVVGVHDAHIASAAEEHSPREDGVSSTELKVVGWFAARQIAGHAVGVENGFSFIEACDVACVVDHQHTLVCRWGWLSKLMEAYGGAQTDVLGTRQLLQLCKKGIVAFARRQRPVAVYLYLLGVGEVVCLAHLQRAAKDFLSQVGVARLLHAVVCDENGGYQFNLLGKGRSKTDGGIGHEGAVGLGYYVEEAHVEAADVLCLEEMLLAWRQLECGAPIIHGALAGLFLGGLATCQEQQTYYNCNQFPRHNI